jgi:hypothetical protein
MNVTAIVVTAVLAAGFVGLSWIVADYNIRSELAEAAVRDKCTAAGGSSVRTYHGFQCINPHRKD